MRKLRPLWMMIIALALLINTAQVQGRRGGGKNRQPRRNADLTTPTFLTTIPAGQEPYGMSIRIATAKVARRDALIMPCSFSYFIRM